MEQTGGTSVSGRWQFLAESRWNTFINTRSLLDGAAVPGLQHVVLRNDEQHGPRKRVNVTACGGRFAVAGGASPIDSRTPT